jgi:ribosomal protein S6--L-glutamate ligase
MQRLSAERPLIIKPYIGGRAEGVQIVRSPGELAILQPPSEPVVIQEFIPDADEIKVYVIGQDVFGIRKRETPSGSVRTACAVSPEIQSIALRCGRLFGLGLYGLDVLESLDGPLVVDVNYFPSYKGVPNAAQLVANFVDDYANGRIPELIPSDRQLRRGAAAERVTSSSVPGSSSLVITPTTDVRIGADLRYYVPLRV